MLRFIFVLFFLLPSLTPMQCIGKLRSLKFVQHASDGYGREYVSFAHSLLYLLFLFLFVLCVIISSSSLIGLRRFLCCSSSFFVHWLI